MKKLTTDKGEFGPFREVVEVQDGYLADLRQLPFSVVGRGEIADWSGPKPVNETALAKYARNKRDALMDRFERDNQWRYRRNSREVRKGKTPTEDISALDNYMQALADITDQDGFPTDITWPEVP